MTTDPGQETPVSTTSTGDGAARLSIEHFHNEASTTEDQGSMRSILEQDNRCTATDEEWAIIQKENRRVLWSRILVLLVLVLSAIGVAVAAYYWIATTQHQAFVAQFDSDAAKLLQAIGSNLGHSLGAADAFAVNLVSYARNTNATWPQVTLPGFYQHASKLLRLSPAFRVGPSMLVPSLGRTAWQDYALEHHGEWIVESVAAQEADPLYHGPIRYEYNVSRDIYWIGPVNATEPQWCFPRAADSAAPLVHNETHDCYYYATWQHTPVMPGMGRPFPYNFDLFGNPAIGPTALYCMASGVPVMSAFGQVPLNEAQAERFKKNHPWIQQHIPIGDDPSEPTFALIYPIIDNLEEAALRSNKPSQAVSTDKDGKGRVPRTPQENKVVGTLNFAIRWVEVLRNILPSSSGVVAVFHQGCGPSLTYEIQGGKAFYLGVGAHFEATYEDAGLVYQATLADMMNSTSSSTSVLPLATEYCPKSVDVYPSPTIQSTYENNIPIIVAVSSALLFVFVSVVFMMYDMFVSRRQRKVLTQAILSGRIVSSLFPSNVKEQLMKEEKQKRKAAAGGKSPAPSLAFTKAPPSSALQHSGLSSSNATSLLDASLQQRQSSGPRAPAIAESYEQTTVLMADLAGFTRWSSTRTPVQVFELLETLYGAFDSIAASRKVFKIETVGDCYIAVTGVPNYQRDHAIRMGRFARACINEMNRITTAIAGDSEDDDTAQLQLRVGLHSGPVTAGVLRGDRARYQLFGETVNAAQFMESTGIPGRIHVSKATAHEVRLLGKKHWLLPRQEQGSASLPSNTFWLTVYGSTASSFGKNYKNGTMSSVEFLSAVSESERQSLADADEISVTSDQKSVAGGLQQSLDGDTLLRLERTTSLGVNPIGAIKANDHHDATDGDEVPLEDFAQLEQQLFRRL